MRHLIPVLLIAILSYQATFAQTKDYHEKYIVQDSISLTLPSGGNVCAMVVRKDTNIQQPCLLLYNIYADTGVWKYESAKIPVRRGYVAVEVTTRGKHCSTDALAPFEHEAEDGYYIIDWISKQPWCNGKVGMLSGSYLGFTQWATTKHLHPALKTIIPEVAAAAGIDFPMQNGVLPGYTLRWLHLVSDNKLTNYVGFADTAKWNNVFIKWYKSGTRFSSLDSVEGAKHNLFQRWLQHPDYDEYWKKMTPQGKEFANINIPVLSLTGYWDDEQLGAMYYYKQHLLHNKNANHYLVIGPYDHGSALGGDKDTLAGLPIDSAAILGRSLIYEWFDYILKDSSKPALLSNKVNFEILGKNEWKHVASLNEMYNDSLELFLSNGNLQKAKPAATQFVQQTVDFKDRKFIKQTGDAIMNLPTLVFDSLSLLPEQLKFTSDPVETPFAISGSYEANLKFSINKKDIDIGIELYEQLPNGKYVALSVMVQRASYTKNRSQRQLLLPNKTENLKIDNTFITCKQLSKGSRIVAVIGVNKNPYWQINYGTGKNVSEEDMSDAKDPLKIKWYNDSYLKFRILK
ncbi:CocE/NonD family hydrolase [Chitinophaga sp. HK235]|uniref:CocE/NonD family hydrolase n=1 Tax=Chitinophaga sp. HK235 TaxID=2952571 RepID=UPI001BAB8BB6